MVAVIGAPAMKMVSVRSTPEVFAGNNTFTVPFPVPEVVPKMTAGEGDAAFHMQLGALAVTVKVVEPPLASKITGPVGTTENVQVCRLLLSVKATVFPPAVAVTV